MDQKNDYLKQTGFVDKGNGEILLSGEGKKQYEQWKNQLVKFLQVYYSTQIKTPLFINEGVLKKTGYLDNYPEQIFWCRKSTTDIAKKAITPATCLHYYSRFEGDYLRNSQADLLIGQCARYENAKWKFPFRNSAFTMLELVIIGKQEVVEKKAAQLKIAVKDFLENLDIYGRFFPATDPFFTVGRSGAQLIQKLKGLKEEYVVDVNNDSIAVASINKHEDYFGSRFNIRTENETAHSLCVAFGIERLTAYSLLNKMKHDK